MSLSLPHIAKSRLKPSPLLLVGVATLAVTAAAVIAGPATADVASQTAAAKPPTITVGSNPIDVAVAPQKSEAYVLNDGSLSVINLRTRKQVAEVGTGFQDQTALGVTNAGSRVYLGTFDQNVVKVFNTSSRKVVNRIKVGYGAAGITAANTAKGQFAYVGLMKGQKVVVIKTGTREVVRRIAMPHGVQTVATVPGGQQVWAGSDYSGRIWVVNTANQRVVKRINVQEAGPVVSIAFSPGGSRAWVSGLGGVSVVSVKTGKQVGFIPAPTLFPGPAPINMGDITIAAGGRIAMVVNSTFPDAPAAGSVSVLGTRHLKVRRVIRLGTEPEGIAVDRRRATTYVTNYMDDTVSYFPTPGV